MSASVSSDKSIREAYEADSSGLHLIPDLVARPETIDDVIEIVKKAALDRTSITCAGAQTSTTGASICDKGNSLQISMMRAVKRDLDPLGILAPGNIL